LDSNHTINSKEYWDKRFATGDWEEKGGNHQTHYFYELLYRLLPEHLREEFNAQDKQYTIADIGCAEGDGTDFLAKKFFNAEVSGIDIAESAVEKANMLYPEIDFSTHLNQQYDIIVSSNVLEHFEDPFKHMDELFAHSKKYVVILVPFEEKERIEEHFYTFLYKDFQLKYKDFNLIHLHRITADKNIWNGEQHLFVYQTNADLSEISLKTFGLERIIKKAETELDTVIQKLQTTQQELQIIQQRLQTTKQELYTIKQSKIWKLANKYYIIRDTTPIIKHIFKITKSFKNKGFLETIKIINNKLIKIKPVKNIIVSNYNFSKVIENKNAKKVSVILPVYNQADMIDESIESILSQTYQNFELIIVNDGSTDGVENVLKKYSNDTRIIILNQENQKLPTALNNGFHFATGGYFTWTSADNIMLPRQLEVLVQYLEENPTKGMVFSNYMVINNEGDPLNDLSFRPQNQDKNDINIMRLPNNVTFENLHDSGDNYIGASFMYRRSVAMSIGKYTNDTFGGEDYDYWLRIHNLYPIGFVEDVLYKYRVHNNTLNSKAKELNLYENIQRLLKRDKQRRIFLQETLEYVQINSDFKSPNQKSRNKIFLFSKIKNINELSNINLENKNSLMVLLLDNDIENIDFNILEKFDMLVCSDDFIYSYLDVKDNFKYKLLYLDLTNENDKNFFIKVTTNRLFDKLNIIEKPEILPQYTLNKKIKIAFILESFDKGGLEKVVYNLVTKLNPDKFEFTVLIVGKELGFFGKKLQASSYTVKILDYNLKLFQEILKVKSFDLINYHYTLFGIDICNQFNIPSIYTVHNTYVWLNNYECAKKTHEYEKIDRFICVSDNVMKYFVNKFQIKNPYLDVIPNGFNLSDFHHSEKITREELNLSNDDFIFINLASINGSKMQMLMIEAMKELKIKYKNFKILFVGNILDEKYHTELLNKIKLFNLEDHIIFLDYVPTQKVGSLLKLSDCFLLPSLYEGWSNAIMEAMYCELPLIVTNVGSSNNLITNEDIGIVINNAVSNLIELDSQEILKIVYSDTFINKNALQSAMINIYEKHDIWKKKAKLGKNKILNFYTLDIMAKKYENLFINSYFHLKK